MGMGNRKIFYLGYLATKKPSRAETALLDPIIGESAKLVLAWIKPPKTAPDK